jgi:hypothetical protein
MRTRFGWPAAAALALSLAIGSTGCVLKSTHCAFVNNVGAASSTFNNLATNKGDDSEKAVAKQLDSTVKSEQDGTCK